MSNLPNCIQCKKPCKRVAYALRGKGYLCERCWLDFISEKGG